MDVRAKRRRQVTLHVSRMLASAELRRTLRVGHEGEVTLVTLLADDTIGDMDDQVAKRGGRASVVVWDESRESVTVISVVRRPADSGRHRAAVADFLHRDGELGLLVEYLRSANPGALEFFVTGGETVVELDYDSPAQSLSH